MSKHESRKPVKRASKATAAAFGLSLIAACASGTEASEIDTSAGEPVCIIKGPGQAVEVESGQGINDLVFAIKGDTALGEDCYEAAREVVEDTIRSTDQVPNGSSVVPQRDHVYTLPGEINADGVRIPSE